MISGDVVYPVLSVSATGDQEYSYSGTVLDRNLVPAVADVLAFSDEDDSLIAQTVSAVGTGLFTITAAESCYCVILLRPADRNAVIVARGEISR